MYASPTGASVQSPDTRHDARAEAFAGRRLTWKSIRDVISPEAYANPTGRGLYYFVRDLIVFAAIMVGLYFANAWYLVAPLWILSGFAISALFIVGHDACHGALFKNKRLAWWVGQTAMLPSLHAYNQWSYGHNRVHHGHTIQLEGDFVWRPVAPEAFRELSWFKRVLHRIYWSPVGAGLYYMNEIWARGMLLYTAPQAGALRDKLIVVGFALAVSAACIYAGGAAPSGFDWSAGLWLWTKMALVPFLFWNYCIGFTVYVHHIHDEIPWKGRGEWTPAYGQLFGTINYHIPRFLNFFFHDIFIHMPHHVQVKIPFYNLKLALEDIKQHYGPYVAERNSMFRDYLHSTAHCKLFDAASGRWLPYSAAYPERTANLSPA